MELEPTFKTNSGQTSGSFEREDIQQETLTQGVYSEHSGGNIEETIGDIKGVESQDLIKQDKEGKIEEDKQNVLDGNIEEETVSQNLLNSMTNVIKNDVLSQQEAYKTVWQDVKHDKNYKDREREYYEICPEDLIYFDVLNKDLFINESKKHLEKLRTEKQLDSVPRWSEVEMERMFGKGLNPTSLITSLESIHWFRDNLENKEGRYNVVELGTGAGWATVMLFNNLKEEFGEKGFLQFSIDSSAHAIAITETLLEYSNIPYIVCPSSEDLRVYNKWLNDTEEGRNFSGVVLVYGEFRGVLKKFEENSLSGIYSTHGTAYLSRSEHEELLKISSKTLVDKGVFIADSLNPLYTNKLDPVFTLSQILSPDGAKKRLDAKNIDYVFSNEEIKNNSKYFPDQNVKVLKGFNTEHAYLILRWCNNLLRKLDFNRLIKTVKSLSVTMKVVDDYRADVFPSFLIEDVIKENAIKYEKLSGRPNFPIFMDTQGFKLLKE